MIEQESAAIGVATVFGVLCAACLFNFKLTKFRVYMLSGLSALLRTVSFAFRAAFYSSVADDAPVTNYSAVDLVLSAAGLGISLAVFCLIMGCWFKNASAASKPPFADRWRLTIAVRLLIAPFVIFGPILGICIATYFYGYGDPGHLSKALELRKAASWGFMSSVIVLLIFVVVASGWAVTAAKRGGKPLPENADALVLVTLFCVLLLTMAVAFRLVQFYHPKFGTDDSLYYPCVILPQLVELSVICIPRLMARMGMGQRYAEWQGLGATGKLAVNGAAKA